MFQILALVILAAKVLAVVTEGFVGGHVDTALLALQHVLGLGWRRRWFALRAGKQAFCHSPGKVYQCSDDQQANQPHPCPLVFMLVGAFMDCWLKSTISAHLRKARPAQGGAIVAGSGQ